MAARGTLAELDIERLNLHAGDVELPLTGKLISLHDPARMQIHAKITDAKLNARDLAAVMPTMGFSAYEGFGEVTIDSLVYVGEPATNLRSSGTLRAKGGRFSYEAMMFYGDELRYQLSASSKRTPLTPLTGTPVILVADTIFVSGTGSSLANLELNAAIDMSGTRVGATRFDSLRFDARARGGLLELTRGIAQSGSQTITLDGWLRDAEGLPTYEARVEGSGVDLAKLANDSLGATSINFALELEGTSFDPETIDATLKATLAPSDFYGAATEDTLRATFEAESGENERKRVAFWSDVATFEATGKFRYDRLGALVGEQIASLLSTADDRLGEFVTLDDSLLAAEIDEAPIDSTTTAIRFEGELIDLDPIAAMFPDLYLVASGTMQGQMNVSPDVFQAAAAIDFSTFGFANNGTEADAFDVRLTAELTHDKTSRALGLQLFADASDVFLDGGRGASFHELSASAVVLENGIDLAMKGRTNNGASMDFASFVDFEGDEMSAKVERLRLKYLQYELETRAPFTATLNDDGVFLKEFNLHHGDSSRVTLDAEYLESGATRATLTAEKFDGYDLLTRLGALDSLTAARFGLNLKATLEGALDDPKFDLDLDVDHIRLDEVALGAFHLDVGYDDLELTATGDYSGGEEAEPLRFEALVPVDLRASGNTGEFVEGERYRLKLLADNFDLSRFNGVLPSIEQLNGAIDSDIEIQGAGTDWHGEGALELTDASFLVLANNLEYGLDLRVELDRSNFLLEKFDLRNTDEVEYPGRFRGQGRFEFDGLQIVNAEAIFRGDLMLLSEKSRARNPNLYGDFYVGTAHDVIFKSDENGTYFNATILVKEADVVHTPAQSAYSGGGGNFVYRWKDDGAAEKLALELERRKALIARSEQKKLGDEEDEEEDDGSGLFRNFEYSIVVRVEDEAYMTVKDVDLTLRAALKGDLRYEFLRGVEHVQGELELMDDSELELYNLKSFNANGSIRFESDIMNPYIDIVAVYQDYVATAEGGGDGEEAVAVKIKIEGPLANLGKNFAQQDDNIALYIGEESIDQDRPTPGYDAADALLFVVTGTLRKSESSNVASSGGQANAVEGAAASVAGSLIGGWLNNQFGDVVRSLDVRSGATGAKFNLAGKYKGVRYSFGGGTNVLQDLSTANIKVEYPLPLVENLLLRFERRETVNDFYQSDEMVNDLGLKYRFKF